MMKYVLKIDGMRCSMCEAHVCDILRRNIPGAKKVHASHAKGEATFFSEDEIQLSEATAQIEATGYRVLSTQTLPAKKGLLGWK